jgi:hypothetical protein
VLAGSGEKIFDFFKTRKFFLARLVEKPCPP